MCDNLTTYVINGLKEFTSVRSIFMLPIMVRTPQWFQVYDQQPFAILKKSMGRTNNGFSRVISLGPKEMNAFMEDIFMTVESKALVPENVQKSFADLGLYPWNPDALENCVGNIVLIHVYSMQHTGYES